MAKRVIAAIAIVSVLSGCTHVRRVDPVAAGRELDGLNRTLERRRVSVEVVSRLPWGRDEKLPAEGVCVGADSTSLTLLLEPRGPSALWGEPRYAVKRDTILSTAAITRIVATDRLRGTMDGGLLGLGAGAVSGALFFALVDEPGEVGERAAIGGLLFGMIGTGIGLAAGTLVGAREVYDFVGR